MITSKGSPVSKMAVTKQEISVSFQVRNRRTHVAIQTQTCNDIYAQLYKDDVT